MVNSDDLIKTTVKLEKILEELEVDYSFLEEEQYRWGNYLSFDEIKRGKEDERKYKSIKYETPQDKIGCEKERKAREEALPSIYRDVKKAGNFLRKGKELGYDKIPEFRRLYNKLESFVQKIKNRKAKGITGQ